MADYEQLKNSILLAGLNDEQLKRFWNAGKVKALRTGDEVIREGEVDSSMFILLEGAVEISQSLLLRIGRDVGQKEKTLIRLNADQRPVFGEMSLIEDAERSATVTSVTDSKVLAIERVEFERIVSEDPVLGCVVFRNLGQIISRRLRKANVDVLKLTTALSLALSP